MPRKPPSVQCEQLRDIMMLSELPYAHMDPQQIERIRCAYRLSQVGHLGVNLLHDLANNVTALNLELESLQKKRRPQNLENITQIISYLDEIVQSTRDHLRGATTPCFFNLANSISKAVTFLNYKADHAGVFLDWRPNNSNLWCYGEQVYLCQVVVVLISNAIEAYKDCPSHKNKRVLIRLSRQNKQTVIKVCDWGKGIPADEQGYLFNPFYTTKEDGLGVGLFLVRQTIEKNFSGLVYLNEKSRHTEFVIKLPQTSR